MSVPAQRTDPFPERSSPTITRSKVVFPAPLAPISPIDWPGRRLSETSCSTGAAVYPATTCSTDKMAVTLHCP